MTMRNSLFVKLSIYIGFILAWLAVYEHFIVPFFPDTLSGYLMSSLVIFVTVSLPSLYLIYKNPEGLALSFQELWSFSFRSHRIVMMMLVMLIYFLTLTHTEEAIIYYDLTHFSDNVMHSIFLDGIAIEIVFRGLLLNVLMKKMENWQAVTVNTLIYLLAYAVFWAYQTSSLFEAVNSGAVILVVVLNIVYSALFIRKKSLWPSLLMHSFWNLGLYIFI